MAKGLLFTRPVVPLKPSSGDGHRDQNHPVRAIRGINIMGLQYDQTLTNCFPQLRFVSSASAHQTQHNAFIKFEPTYSPPSACGPEAFNGEEGCSVFELPIALLGAKALIVAFNSPISFEHRHSFRIFEPETATIRSPDDLHAQIPPKPECVTESRCL